MHPSPAPVARGIVVRPIAVRIVTGTVINLKGAMPARASARLSTGYLHAHGCQLELKHQTADSERVTRTLPHGT